MFIQNIMFYFASLNNNIMYQSGEIYSVIESFEKYAKLNLKLSSLGFAKEDKEHWKKQFIYCDGELNKSFMTYLHGFSLGKSFERLNNI